MSENVAVEKLVEMLEKVKSVQSERSSGELAPHMKYGKFTIARDLTTGRLHLTWDEYNGRTIWEAKAPFVLSDVPIAMLALLDSYQAVFEHLKAGGGGLRAGNFPTIRDWKPIEIAAGELGVDTQAVLDFVENVNVIPSLDGSPDLVMVDPVELAGFVAAADVQYASALLG